MNHTDYAGEYADPSVAKARDFRQLGTDEVLRKHPDLANAYAVVKLAELVAEIQLAVDADRAMLGAMMKETVAERIEQRMPLPVVRNRFGRPQLDHAC